MCLQYLYIKLILYQHMQYINLQISNNQNHMTMLFWLHKHWFQNYILHKSMTIKHILFYMMKQFLYQYMLPFLLHKLSILN